MRLYKLVRYPLPDNRARQEFDVAEGMVVAAKDEKRAREIASEHAGDEGPNMWIAGSWSICNLIARRTDLPEGLVLRDFRDA